MKSSRSTRRFERFQHPASAVASLLLSTQALAQTEPAASRLDTVIVTVQKREQAALDVPGAVTALNADRLAQGGLSRLEDYVAQVPGLSISSQGPGYLQMVLRGVSTGVQQSAPTTSVYIDEAPIGSANAYAYGSILAPDLDPAELTRIEVAKGPQGTLFGAGAMGGVLRYVTAKPDFSQFSGSVTLGADSVAHGGSGGLARGMLNLPLDERSALRISAFGRREPGFIDNPVNGASGTNASRTGGGRLAFAWKPMADWRVDASAMLQRVNADGPSLVDVDRRTLQPMTGERTRSALVAEPRQTEFDVFNLAVHGNVGAVSLVSSTTYETIDAPATDDVSPQYGPLLALYTGDADFGAGSDHRSHTRRFSQELRAETSALDDRLDLAGGLYFTSEGSRNELLSFDTFSLASGAEKPVVIPGTQIPYPDGAAKASILTHYRELSAFANASYALTKKFDLQIGARYGEVRQHYDQAFSGLIFTPPVLFTQDTKEGKATWLLTGRYKPSTTEAWYARVATGYRPGGPSAAPPSSGRASSVAADSLTSLEAGYKAVLAAGKASFEAAIFRTRWNDIQIQTSGGGTVFFVNGGSAISQGVESTLGFYPIAGLSLHASAAYTDAALSEDTNRVILDEGTPLARPLGREGDRLPFVPRISASLAADYRWAVAGGWSATLGGSLNRIGRRASDFSGAGTVEVPGYTTVNLNAGLDNGHWRVIGYIKNAGDSGGIVYLADRGLGALTPSAAYAAGLIQPRTVGVEATWRF